ncbi:hypothetical protein [Bifidobacterium breve]|nr:hypothetical protein [Bifidobacterium breve]
MTRCMDMDHFRKSQASAMMPTTDTVVILVSHMTMGLFDFAKNSLGDVPSGFGGRGDIANHLFNDR